MPNLRCPLVREFVRKLATQLGVPSDDTTSTSMTINNGSTYLNPYNFKLSRCGIYL